MFYVYFRLGLWALFLRMLQVVYSENLNPLKRSPYKRIQILVSKEFNAKD